MLLMLIKSFGWNGLSSSLVAFFQFVQILIVGYFLTTYELGLMALAQVMTGVGYLLMDSGLSNLIVQKKNINKFEKSTILLTSIFLSLLIIIILNSCSGVIGEYYRVIEIQSLIMVLSVVFVFAPFQQFYTGLYQRALLFSFIAIVDIVASFMGLLTVTYFAYVGEGAFSLVYGVIVVVISKVIIYVFFGSQKFIINITHFDTKFFRNSIIFGFYQLGERFINLLATQIDTLIIGKILGTDVLGVYSLAKTLILKGTQLFYSVISKTLFPIFSKYRDDFNYLQQLYLKTFKVVMLIVSILFSIIILFLATFPFSIFLSEEKWPAILSLMPYFCLMSVGMVVTYISSAALLAKGKVKLLFWVNLISLVLNTIVIVLLSKVEVHVILYGLIAVMYLISSCVFGYFNHHCDIIKFQKHCLFTTLAYLPPLIIFSVV